MIIKSFRGNENEDWVGIGSETKDGWTQKVANLFRQDKLVLWKRYSRLH